MPNFASWLHELDKEQKFFLINPTQLGSTFWLKKTNKEYFETQKSCQNYSNLILGALVDRKLPEIR